jgi:hypothetical protein
LTTHKNLKFAMDNKMKASIQSGKQTLEPDSSGASEKKSTLAAWILQQLASATLKQTFFNFLRSKKKGTILHAFLHIKTDH